MGSIIERKRKDGSIAYMAQVTIQRQGKLHREAETFTRRAAATGWIKKREAELRDGSAPFGLKHSIRQPTLANAIDRYIAESQGELGSTKKQVLAAIKKYDIADMPCAHITSTELVAFAQELLTADRQPQTVSNYLSHLQAVFSVAGPAWGFPLAMQAMQDAFTVSRKLGVVKRAMKRDRRPSMDEMDKLVKLWALRARQAMPMAAIAAFAMFSTRRLAEITRIRWGDYQQDRILVRDMKHPGQKEGNHVWCDVPEEARRIIDAMPKTAAEIFPWHGDTISITFTRACHLAGVEDFRFHDLRHEGVSRLFEMGKTVPQVAAVSGHRSWGSLQRYTHLRQEGDKWQGWRGIDHALEDLAWRCTNEKSAPPG